MDFVVADGVALVGGVGEAVLVAEVFVDFGVDLVEGLFLGSPEELAAGFPGDLFQDFLAVGALLLRVPSTAAAAAHPAAAPTHSKSPGAAVVFVFIGKQDGVDDGVGALGGGNGLGHGFLAAVVHTVRKKDQRLAALLLAHQFVRGQENRVIKKRSTAVPATAAASPTSAAIATASPAVASAPSTIILGDRKFLQRRLQLRP